MSEFLKTFRDIRRMIPAGEIESISGMNGRFIFVKYATYPIRVSVSGQQIEMMKGDKARFEEMFSGVEIENLGQGDNYVTLVVGVGDYDRKTITGEVTVSQGIRNAAGEWMPDTRRTVDLVFAVDEILNTDYAKGALIKEYAAPAQSGIFYGTPVPLDKAGNRFVLNGTSDALLLNKGISGPWVNVPKLGQSQGALWGQNEIVVMGNPTLPVSAVLRFYDRATLQLKRVIPVSGAPVSNPNNPIMGALIVTRGGQIIAQVSGASYVIDGLSGVAEPFPAFDFSAGGYAGYYVEYGGKIFKGNSTGMVAAVDAMTLQPVSTAGGFDPDGGFPPGSYSPGGVWSNGEKTFAFLSNSVDGNSGNMKYRERAARDLRYSVRASASVNAIRYFKQDSRDLLAGLSSQIEPDGRVTISGEVIRAALEAWAGHEITDGYLDYVYGVEFENGTGKTSGGVSFEVAEIEDDFVMGTPEKIRITVRDGLL